ncbi:hypothetical protein RFM26_10305 [Mesorhizobium sp. VK23B]|uniref:Class I SAM-dependent methyltransferase n=1 Tax=Mesorhizobium dulcispinae TaxID=3072316 RepID=A0ABU4XAS0_9HYPH|nr:MULTISPECIES: hypothetical protein [unclassified Mesorhizobium]MDX8466071.1 hypothetical protein [Mesorhizobium sp. VK23B]MDX8471882.1 hypothetical protein [Mesorhizobium sp. VK23A]
MADMQGAQHWNENNSRSFLDYGRYFVPERERQIDMIADLIPAARGGLLVELCSGEGLLSRTLWGRCPAGHKGGRCPAGVEWFIHTKTRLRPQCVVANMPCGV